LAATDFRVTVFHWRRRHSGAPFTVGVGVHFLSHRQQNDVTGRRPPVNPYCSAATAAAAAAATTTKKWHRTLYGLQD